MCDYECLDLAKMVLFILFIPMVVGLFFMVGYIMFSGKSVTHEKAVLAKNDVEESIQKDSEYRFDSHEDIDVDSSEITSSVVVKDNKVGSDNSMTINISVGSGKSVIPWIILSIVFGLWVRSKVCPKKPKKLYLEDIEGGIDSNE